MNHVSPTAFADRFWSRLHALRDRPARSFATDEVPADFREAAVLMPFWTEDDRVRVLLTLRSSALRSHRGQISFPGGRLDPGDAGPLDAALRETWEEVGIARESVRVIGQLDDVWSIQRYRVAPFVGAVEGRPILRPEPGEIERLIVADVQDLMDPTRHEIRWVEKDGVSYAIHYYHYGEDVIWGMTGGLLHWLFAWVRGEEPGPGTNARDELLRYLRST